MLQVPTFNFCTTCMGRPDIKDDRTSDSTEPSSQATWVIAVLGLFFDMLCIGVCATRHWSTSGRLVQE